MWPNSPLMTLCFFSLLPFIVMIISFCSFPEQHMWQASMGSPQTQSNQFKSQVTMYFSGVGPSSRRNNLEHTWVLSFLGEIYQVAHHGYYRLNKGSRVKPNSHSLYFFFLVCFFFSFSFLFLLSEVRSLASQVEHPQI